MAVIIIAYGSDILSLFQWIVLSGLTERVSIPSPVSKLPPEDWWYEIFVISLYCNVVFIPKLSFENRKK